jgi:uncharacterized membrane protein HdeD (DUF308 family)
MTTALDTSTAGAAAPIAPVMRTVYLSRSGFAIIWAALLVVTASSLDSMSSTSALTVALLVIYPLVDLAAAVIDLRSSAGTARPPKALLLNMALSLIAAIGLAVAVSSDLAAVLRVWGAWAITAGIVQLVIALRRRRLGGQWAQILSGGISVLAGGSFIAQAGSSSASLGSIAGYAVLGGIFFLISAVRLHRAAKAVR